MNQYAFRTSLFVFLFSVMSVNAQESFKHWAVGIEGGTYGAGVTVATSLTKNIKLRVGFDGFGYKFATGIDDVSFTGYIPDGIGANDVNLSASLSDIKWSTQHFKLLVDLYPMKNGVFSFTVGMFAGNNSFSLDGKIADYARMVAQYGRGPVFDFNEIIIQPDQNGNFGGKVLLGNTIKPYVGLGLGRTIAKKRIGFKVDLGIVYQGKIRTESPNVPPNINVLTSGATNYVDEYIPTFLSKIWPMLNLSLSYRIL